MTDAEKAPFVKLAEKEKARYLKETAELKAKGYFINQDGENSKDLFLKKQKEEIQPKPKRTMTSYMAFVSETAKNLRIKNPEMKITEATSEASNQWKTLSDRQKEPYVKLAE